MLRGSLAEIERARASLTWAVENYTIGKNHNADPYVAECRSSLLKAERTIEQAMKELEAIFGRVGKVAA
jgi:exonuclease VII small subunit